MAAVISAKRPRAPTNGIDTRGPGHDSHNKRLRRSPENEEQMSNDEGSQAPDSDGATDDEQDNAREETQMAWATQQVQRDFRATANKQNVPTDSGIIEEIQCINFMCHEHLTVTLGPLINFIIGHNGSGKSAVLTALQICLGGKATATNRAQNLKSLIKEGRERCSVQVRIKNQGPLAYKPRDYGKSIIVERHFSTTGASGFKLKDENNRVVSTKKVELEDILDAFSMQIDNPMNVLTQDMARQFLNHSTPKDKYKFFLQGTQLENLNRDYQQIENSLELMNSKAQVKETDLAQLRKAMEELASRARRAENLERMRAREAELAHQAAWAKVQEEEAEVAEAEAEVQNANEKIESRNAEAEEAGEAFDRATTTLEEAQATITEITVQTEPAQQRVQELRDEFQQIRDRLLALKTDERTIGGDIKHKKELVNRHQREIEQHRQRQAEADNGLYAAKQTELADAKEAAEQAKQAHTAHVTGSAALQANIKSALSNKASADQQVAKCEDHEQAVKDNIRSLSGDQRNWFDSYQNSAGLRKLLQAIENDRRFREKPVGPMGRYVKLVEPEWGYILEKQSGALLNGFVVTSKADQSVLSELMRRNNWQAPIYIGNRNPINTSHHEPDPSLMTWMKALRIDDHLIRNQLIINQGIEQTVLIESPREGAQFMHSRGPRTSNVKMCFTFKDGDKTKGRVINYTGNGGVNNSPIDEFRGQFRMQVDKEAQLREEQARLAHVQQSTRDAQEVLRVAVEHLRVCRQAEQEHNQQAKQLNLRHQHAQDAVERLEGELSDATPDAAAIEVLEEQLDNAQEELQRAEGVFEDMVLQRDSINEDSRKAKRALDEADVTSLNLKAKLDKAHTKVRILQGKREEALRTKNQVLATIGRLEENKAAWEEARNERQREVDSTTEQARIVCNERVAVPQGKSSEQLIQILNRLILTRRETEKTLGGSQEELLRQANAAKHTHMEAMKEFDSITRLRNHLIKTLHNRRVRWKQFRSGISVRARVTFNYLLSERKFRGTLSIDHKNLMLDIHVQPDSMEKAGEGRQTKTLSGGEKSFSTVCLLLSLWDAMGSPIRCLDEFDVFMDSVNRDRSMKMIIAAARRSVGRQFIFITPQAMNSVQQDSDVKIIRMLDPERGQTALAFGQ